MKWLIMTSLCLFGLQAFACIGGTAGENCAPLPSPLKYVGMTPQERKHSFEFSTADASRNMLVVFKTSVDFADEEGEIITSMGSFPKSAYSLKVCTEEAEPALKDAHMHTCCGSVLPGTLFTKIPDSNCYTLDAFIYLNPKYRLEFVFEDNAKAWFDTFYPSSNEDGVAP